MADTVTIKFNCPECGGRIVWDEDAGDDELARCEGCDEDMPTVGALKKRAMDETKKYARDQIKNAFKGSKIKFR